MVERKNQRTVVVAMVPTEPEAALIVGLLKNAGIQAQLVGGLDIYSVVYQLSLLAGDTLLLAFKLIFPVNRNQRVCLWRISTMS